MIDNAIMLSMEQSQPTPQELDARIAAGMRAIVDLPVDATDEQLRAAQDARIAAGMRAIVDLPVDATDEQLRAAREACIAASRIGGTALQ